MSLGAPIDTRSHVHDPNTIYSPEVALMEVFCRFSLPQTMSSMYRQQQLLCSEFVVDVFQLILRPALISMNQSINQPALHCLSFAHVFSSSSTAAASWTSPSHTFE